MTHVFCPVLILISFFQIPYDILKYLAEKYHLKTEDLMKPFVKGLLTGLDEQDSKESALAGSQTLKP